MLRNFLLIFGMFILIFVSDFVWTWWSKACAKNQKYQAATSSVIIYLIGGITVLGYVEYPWLLVPACIGAFFGTYFAMKWVK